MADTRREDDGDERWREHAACRRSSVDFFDEQQEATAVAVCRGCPVIGPCRATALQDGPPEGVWGGLTPRDRRVLVLRARQQRRAVASPEPQPQH